MYNLIRAELLKLRTTRMLWLNAVAALVFVPLSLAITIQTAGDEGAGPALTTSEGLRGAFSAASSGSVVILMLGVLIMAGEFRHKTATSTFLITPELSGVRHLARTLDEFRTSDRCLLRDPHVPTLRTGRDGPLVPCPTALLSPHTAGSG
jgi:hypothetical protein